MAIETLPAVSGGDANGPRTLIIPGSAEDYGHGYGYPETSAPGLKALASIKQREELDRITGQDFDKFNDSIATRLQKLGDEGGLVEHLTWRLLHKLGRGIAIGGIKSDEVVIPMHVDPWDQIEPSFRIGAAILLSEAADIELQDISHPAVGSSDPMITAFGAVTVANTVTWHGDQAFQSVFSFKRS